MTGKDAPYANATFEEIRSCLEQLERLPATELRVRHHLCTASLALIRQSKPRDALRLAASSLGVAPTTLSRWACVARCFDAEAVERLLAHPKAHKITFWHLVELSRLHKKARDLLVARVLEEGLSVAQVRGEIKNTHERETATVAASRTALP